MASYNVVFNEKKKGEERSLSKRPQTPLFLQESGIAVHLSLGGFQSPAMVLGGQFCPVNI